MIRRTRLRVLAASLTLAGCGYQPDLPPMAPVSGTVTLDGEPLPRGNVQFVPDVSKGNSGPSAVAEIQPDGTYSLETQGEPGAMVGFHRVRIESRAEPRDETDTMPATLIPLAYGRHTTSGLAYEVKAEQDNVIPIELTKNVGPRK